MNGEEMFDFFLGKSKGSMLSSGLLQGMTDIHTHLLPGVDDGAGSLEEAVEAIRALAGSGVKNIWLTPHVMDRMPEDYKERFKEQYALLYPLVPDGISIRLAAEYMLDACFLRHLENGLLPLGNNHVLVETSYAAPPLDLDGLLFKITLEGYTPVLAHPERYTYMSGRNYTRLKKRGCLFQMNLLSVMGFYGKTAEKKASALLGDGFYDFVGTDIHNLERFVKGATLRHLSRKKMNALRKLVENNSEANL